MDFRILFRPLPRDADLVASPPRSGPPKNSWFQRHFGDHWRPKMEAPQVAQKSKDESTRPILGGGVSHIFFMFNPKIGEDEPNWTCAYFSKELVQPPTSTLWCFRNPKANPPSGWCKKKLRIFKGEKLYQPQLVSERRISEASTIWIRILEARSSWLNRNGQWFALGMMTTSPSPN